MLSVLVTNNGQIPLAVAQLSGLILSSLVIRPIHKSNEDTLIWTAIKKTGIVVVTSTLDDMGCRSQYAEAGLVEDNRERTICLP
jgi:hypothetical protein